MAAIPTSPLAKAGGALLNSGNNLIKPPKAPKPIPLKPGVGQAGSALTNLAGKLSQPQQASTANPPANPAGASAGGAGGAPSDLDSTYYQNVANYLYKTNNSINADQAKIGNDQTALQTALGTLAYQQPRDQLALEQKANAGGGLFSSVYSQNLGNLNQKYLTSQNADTTKYGGDIQALATAIANLQGGLPLYESGQAEASAGRAATLAANAAPPAATPAPVLTNARVANPVRPANVPANAVYGGSKSPGSNYKGVGGGWWVKQ